MPLRDVTFWYYELTCQKDFIPANRKQKDLAFHRARICVPSFGLYLNNAVGGPHHWTLRQSWSDAEWNKFWYRSELEVWVAWLQGTPIGYFEIEWQPDHNAEFVKFGVVPEFTGMGIGSQMLTFAIDHCWKNGTQRIWLYTTELD
ncbi:MAG: GNAT family N-acetyltransferase, partial [Planctomycetes bacterium]|nr:GNAT family N-acetyltransferase [Planctomycetota bacterium]